MKKLIYILFLFVTLNSSAQKLKQGSVSCLLEQDKVGLRVNYSDAIILGMQEEDYTQHERKWELCKQEAYGGFVKYFSLQIENILFGQIKNVRYSCEAHILSIDANYRCTAELLIIDEQLKDTMAVISPIHSPGGGYGTAVRRIKSNMGYIGQNAGRALNKYLQKARSKGE